MSFLHKKNSQAKEIVAGTGDAMVCPVTGRRLDRQEVALANEESDPIDLSAVRADLRRALRYPGHDDGSLAPLFIRFAWHCSGTYDKSTGTGGSNGATMRFAAEQNDPENKGLEKARRVLEGIHNKHKYLSLADIFILAGYVALEATGGPVIPFSSGRRDFSEEQAQQVYGPSLCPVGDGKLNPCGSRLPAADLGPAPDVSAAAPPEKREKPTIDHVRNTFHRMGLSDKETVLLIIMGHQYGRMHPEVSGYEHTWYAFDPNHECLRTRGAGISHSICNAGKEWFES